MYWSHSGTRYARCAERVRGDVDATRPQPLALLGRERSVVADDVRDRVGHLSPPRKVTNGNRPLSTRRKRPARRGPVCPFGWFRLAARDGLRGLRNPDPIGQRYRRLIDTRHARDEERLARSRPSGVRRARSGIEGDGCLLLRELLLDLLVDLVLAVLPSASDDDQAHDPRPDERHHQTDEDR